MRGRAVSMALLAAAAWPLPAALAQPAGSAAIAPADTGQPIPEAKLNQYIKGYNFLIGTFGLRDQARLYAAQQIAAKQAGAPVNVAVGWIGLGDDDLKKGRDMEGAGLPEVDAAANDMIPILDRLVERLKGLEAYYASRGQLEDGFARGKREDPLVLADFKAALAALGPLEAALSRAIDRRDIAEVTALKERGDLVGYDGGLALYGAKRLIGLVQTPEQLHDAQLLAAGDGLADGILAALADEGTALDAAKAAGDTGQALRNSMYGTAAGDLRNVVGAWRDMKRSGNLQLRMVMISAYNAAVRNINVGN